MDPIAHAHALPDPKGNFVDVHFRIATNAKQVGSDTNPKPPAEEGGPQMASPTHTPDFASVNWYGERYSFSRKQRIVVSVLWDAHREGTPYVSQETILQLADSDATRLVDLFRGHPSWGKMIEVGTLSGGPIGTYRLAFRDGE